ncbi:MAG: ABC transporter substrate-binding protein, partial [Coleofasciculaceae cyanobacterium RL_1_1]|nr:ABC transporter substrate-binding protein [Coleofasciculaceae cyanobacterium RL_1_1]
MLYLVKAAAEKAGSVDPEAVQNAMRGLSWETPQGTKTIREGDNQAVMTMYVVQINDGDFEVKKPFLFCNPVDKNGEGIIEQADHLTPPGAGRRTRGDGWAAGLLDLVDAGEPVLLPRCGGRAAQRDHRDDRGDQHAGRPAPRRVIDAAFWRTIEDSGNPDYF